jgi:hypothetical protein
VRSHAKVSSAGPSRVNAAIEGIAWTRIALSAAVTTAALLVVLLAPAPADAAYHRFVESFGSAAKPQFTFSQGLAVEQSNGDVLVVNAEAKTISRFNSDGTPHNFSALTGNVIDGQGAGDGTPQNGFSFGYSSDEHQIAVDNSGTATNGDIYLAQRGVVDVFATTGAYLGQLTESSEGAFGNATGVAVDSSGSLYVGDSGFSTNKVRKYVPSANPPVNADNSVNFALPADPRYLAVGGGPTAGYLFVKNGNSEIVKVDSSTGAVAYTFGSSIKLVATDSATGHVFAIGSSGSDEILEEFDASPVGNASLVSVSPLTVESPEEAQSNFANGLAIDGPSAHIYVSVPPEFGSDGDAPLSIFGPLAFPLATRLAEAVTSSAATLRGGLSTEGEAATVCEFEYGTVESGSYAESAPCEGSIPADSEEHEISAAVDGLADHTEYHFRITVTTAGGVTTTTAGRAFTTLRHARTAPASDILSSSATLNGAVRPEGLPQTTCRFEYGATTAYGLIVPCAEAVPADFGSHGVSAQVSGLEAETVYHFRVVVADSSGTYAGQDKAFTTTGQSGLPDSRAYEQVSPVDKNESDINFSADFASTSGDKLAYLARGAFAGAPTAQGVEGNSYLATRGPNGWTTESTGLPGGELDNTTGYLGYTSDLSKGLIRWREDNPDVEPYDPNAAHGRNLYMRDNATGAFQLVNGPEQMGGAPWAFVWGSSDFSHLALDTGQRLTEDSPCLGFEQQRCAYEWVDGTIRVASVLPTGELVPGAVGGAVGGNGGACNFEHAMSDDGSRLYFTHMFFGIIPREIYARENGTSTTRVTGSERTLPGGASGYPFYYQSAEAAHGDKVLFSTKNSLVDADSDETGDLYLYDFNKPEGERLTLVSEDQNPASPQGASVLETQQCLSVVGTSEDLKRIYYVADNQIVEGEPEDTGPKLYLWDDTSGTPQTTYIGTLSGKNDYWAWRASVYNGETSMRNARWSANGHYLAFVSSAQLTDFENEEYEEMYRYDAVAHQLDCISCTADSITEGPPTGEDEVGFNKIFYTKLPMNHQLRNVSEDGMVFFQSFRSLVPRDSNGKQDVYEYENGHLQLISRGTGTGDSYFLDASPSGDDVFFLTRDKLVGWDVDNNRDVYDARVGGGFPEPPPSPPACEGDACQPPPNPPNDQTPSSANFSGPGNPKAARHSSRCAKGKVRKKARCVKHHTRKHKRHHPRHSTRANG